ncbi:MAG: 16S rRNA (adenine(1518)-N(6)/adenine(1519)-N(6))-dimethyltransferase RsmA [Bacillota bacterium]|nr:16S rRNA (adenine(1518)-N(6)/adenine(1519)-N(6))-dimethyltransferase RsmA [Bacillota bacterium]
MRGVPSIRPRKNLGQNFLVDSSYLDVIISAADLGRADAVLEIGAGTGILTQALAERAAHVIAVELDDRLVEILRANFAGLPNVDILHADILDLGLTELMQFDRLSYRKCKVVANLPYYITSPVILKLLEEVRFFERIVVLVQKEVAERMVAAPGSKRYGAFSVVVQYHAVAEIVAIVPPEAFRPAPKVDSAVVRLLVRREPPVKVASENLLFAVVRAGFRMRRKTLLRALVMAGQAGLGLPGADEKAIREALERAGIKPERRAETLSLDEFGRLVDALLAVRP